MEFLQWFTCVTFHSVCAAPLTSLFSLSPLLSAALVHAHELEVQNIL